MRSLLFCGLVISLLFCACHRAAKPEENPQDTPKALLEKTAEFSLVSKREADDLIQSLYTELKKATPALQELEKQIETIKQQKEDAAEPFENFDHKNNNYYTATGRYVESIRDSLLKQNIRVLIGKSLDKYNSLVQPHTQLVNILNSKDINLDDLYTVLKLTRTLSMMEKYQQASLPSATPLQVVSQGYDKTIGQTGKLTKDE
jgi:hypothetical protein